MPIKRNLLKVPIIATVGHRIIATTTKGIIMRNDRGIPSGDTILNIVTIIITGRFKDTIIVITTIIIIHTVMAFGFFGGATRIGFKTTSNLFGGLALQPTVKCNMLWFRCMV
jgi:hypothetical protein